MTIIPNEAIQNISKVIFLHTVDNFNHLYAHMEYRDQEEDVQAACVAGGFTTKIVETDHATLMRIDHEDKAELQSLIDWLDVLEKERG